MYVSIKHVTTDLWSINVYKIVFYKDLITRISSSHFYKETTKCQLFLIDYLFGPNVFKVVSVLG